MFLACGVCGSLSPFGMHDSILLPPRGNILLFYTAPSYVTAYVNSQSDSNNNLTTTLLHDMHHGPTYMYNYISNLVKTNQTGTGGSSTYICPSSPVGVLFTPCSLDRFCGL